MQCADDLSSLFQTISLYDTLHFSSLPPGAQADEMTCSDASLKIDSSNLVIRALELMRQRTGRTDLFFRVHLDKLVPMVLIEVT
ncbi:hypothetical protein EON64_08480, partial [archaeon]